MKNTITKRHGKTVIAGMIVCLIIGVSACKENLSTVNNNPNDPKDATPTYLLTSGEAQLAGEYWGTFPLGYFGNLYAQYWSEDQYTEESRYQYRQIAVVNGMFNNYYLALNTLQQIIRQNRNNPDQASAYGPNDGQIAVVQILKAWTFQTLTDIYGSVPYKEALQGASNPTPKYSSQKDIYASLIDTLENASQTLKGMTTVINSGDVFYGGDAQKWRMFANSLIMRLAIREADANTQAAEAAFQFAYNNGDVKAMTSNADDALFHFQPNQPYDNGIYDNYGPGGRDDWGVATTLLKFMNQNNDPRRGAYAQPAVNGGTKKYHGFPYGLNPANAGVWRNSKPWSRPSKRVISADAPAIFMTYSETLFNEAEAAQRGWITDHPAKYFYKKAIMASMKYWDVDSGDAQTYINNHPYQPNNWRQNLGRQKWVALYMQGLQGWSVYRRLDFGLLTPPEDGAIFKFQTDKPVRLPYPVQESSLNDENRKAAIQTQGFSKDDQGQRLWWDKAAQGK